MEAESRFCRRFQKTIMFYAVVDPRFQRTIMLCAVVEPIIQ